MGGTKFMVIKFKELLKTAVFAILGVLIIIAIIYFLVPRGEETALYEPGVYTSSITLDNEKINVEVTVDETRIKNIALVHTTESLPVFYPLFEETVGSIGDEIVKKQSLNVTMPEEASVTAQLLMEAVSDSLNQAKIE